MKNTTEVCLAAGGVKPPKSLIRLCHHGFASANIVTVSPCRILLHLKATSQGWLLNGSFVITYSDVVAGRRKGIPGDVEPAIASEQLVGVFADLQEFYEIPELRGVLRPDVGSLAEKVLGITDTPYLLVDFRIAEA